jgi:hypothetical protein
VIFQGVNKRHAKTLTSVEAKLVLAAQTHSQASVSSPTIRFYSPGTELQVVRREGIWLEVSDSVTQERGWVLAQYLSSIESPTPTQIATESTTEPLTLKPATPKSNKRHRSAKHAVHDVVVANADPWNARWARRADRRRGSGCLCSVLYQDLHKLDETARSVAQLCS